MRDKEPSQAHRALPHHRRCSPSVASPYEVRERPRRGGVSAKPASRDAAARGRVRLKKIAPALHRSITAGLRFLFPLPEAPAKPWSASRTGNGHRPPYREAVRDPSAPFAPLRRVGCDSSRRAELRGRALLRAPLPDLPPQQSGGKNRSATPQRDAGQEADDGRPALFQRTLRLPIATPASPWLRGDREESCRASRAVSGPSSRECPARACCQASASRFRTWTNPPP